MDDKVLPIFWRWLEKGYLYQRNKFSLVALYTLDVLQVSCNSHSITGAIVGLLDQNSAIPNHAQKSWARLCSLHFFN